jgi:U2-associated protein SR140
MDDAFPDLPSKLGAPAKKSLFERQKAEAEAKKARERAETAAVYEDFVKSFDDEGGSETTTQTTPSRHVGAAFGGSTFNAIPGKRHFTSTGLKSGPGSLGLSSDIPKSGPGSLGPALSVHGRKRPYDTFQGQWRDRDRNHGVLAYEDHRPSPTSRQSDDAVSAFHHDDEEEKAGYKETKAAAKPTLHLSSLPPGTSPAVIRALFTPSPLTVEDVRILPPPAPSSAANGERKSTSAIVALAPETPATDIDTMVSHLQNKYLGFGFKLSISRHLSSAALAGASAIAIPSGNLNNLPFGARPIQPHASLSRAPPPGHGHGRFAPPASYTTPTSYGSRANIPPTQVVVQPPTDLKQLKLIHKTLESLLTYGPEFEALLMSRPQIQRDEKWAWLWDSRSVGGVYYRWRLWDILTNGSGRRRRQQSSYGIHNTGEALFEGQSTWVPPEQGLKFEYTTRMDEFISDEDYDSSDEEADYDGGIARRHNDHYMAGVPPAKAIADVNEGTGYLNPLAKTKLVHLLRRLPDSNAKLRKGDVARITSFAIEHAGAGADEVAELLARNVIKPLCSSGARDRKNAESDEQEQETRDLDEDGASTEKKDHSSASLVGLYVISDILSSSASAGVRHAWRYRALLEIALRQRKVFETLGRLERNLDWGKLKAEKWKRSVHNILSLWEGWCVFPQTSQEEFANKFASPPLTAEEILLSEIEERRKLDEDDTRRSKSNSKWRSVEDEERVLVDRATVFDDVDMEEVDGVAMEYDDDDTADGEAIVEDADSLDDNIDGVPMADSSDDEVGHEEHRGQPPSDHDPPVAAGSTPLSTRKPRMKAVDMFADESDAE